MPNELNYNTPDTKGRVKMVVDDGWMDSWEPGDRRAWYGRKPKLARLTDTWIRCNRGTGQHCGRALYPCFDLPAVQADDAKRAGRLGWWAFSMVVLAVLVTWPMWGGR